MKPLSDFNVDRSVFSIVPMEQADDDVAYWLTKTPQERFRAIELMRQNQYGYDPSAVRMQRGLEIVPFETYIEVEVT